MTEDELDTGRWKRTVETAGGKLELSFSLPLLLAELEESTGGAPGAAGGARLSGPAAMRAASERMMLKIQRAMADKDFASTEEANVWLDANVNSITAPLGELDAAADFAGAEPATPLEQAQDLAYEAFEARGRRQVQLARKALEISPDCADAWLVLAQRQGDPAEALPLFQRASKPAKAPSAPRRSRKTPANSGAS